MTALALLAWYGAIALSLVIATITLMIVVLGIREMRKPKGQKTTIIATDRRRDD